MFTGIIETTAQVMEKSDDTLTLKRPPSFTDIKIGSSIAIGGVCLTVIEMNDQQMSFNVIPTTWQKTRLGDLKIGERVNLERALAANGRFDGHIVQGHCEGVGIVENIMENEHPIFVISTPKELMQFIVQHGSITIDGVSLTVAGCSEQSFSVALIPLTLRETTFGRLKIGDKVNLETDIVARYILKRGGERG
jgi:riboflavin synthase